MSEKSAVLETIRGLPEEATFEEIIETLSILAAIRRGERAADAGELVPHDEVEARLESWITKSSGPSPR